MKENDETKIKKLLDMDDIEAVSTRLKRMVMEQLVNPCNHRPAILNEVITLLELIDELKRKNEFYN